jgi:hypothetical protein
MKNIRGLRSTGLVKNFLDFPLPGDRRRQRPTAVAPTAAAINAFALAVVAAHSYSVEPIRALNFAPESS